jgi:TPR repeat protein
VEREVFRRFKAVAMRGHAETQCYVGFMYEKGIHRLGKKTDMNKALRWYRISAKNGNAYAQYLLGRCYFEGKGVTKSDEIAIRHIQQSADNAHPLAQWTLAQAFHLGKCVQKSLVKAFCWAVRAASHDVPPAIYYVALRSINGKESLVKDSEVTRLILRAAELGYPPAQYHMSQLLLSNGSGVTSQQDSAESLRWLKLAAQGGSRIAQYTLGRYLAQGTRFIRRDDCQAAHWYRLSAEQGYRDAQFALGLTLGQFVLH